MVDNNADAARLFLSNAGFLELTEGEATTLADFPVVTDSLGTDGGAEEGEGTDAELSGLNLAGLATAKLAAGLVEPGADTALPVLAEMVGVKDCRLQVNVDSKLACTERFTNRCCAGNPWFSLEVGRERDQQRAQMRGHKVAR